MQAETICELLHLHRRGTGMVGAQRSHTGKTKIDREVQGDLFRS
ncbi:hypothetical protein [Sulfurovum sp.]|nr:hypothetical protein [Sulfurovum sp.]